MNPNQPPQVPMVPMNSATLRANVVLTIFNPNNNGTTLYIFDQRDAPVERLGETPQPANFEIGRFELTPRALRMLADSANAAVDAYQKAHGSTIPTTDQFNAAGAIGGLESLIQAQRPPATDPKQDGSA